MLELNLGDPLYHVTCVVASVHLHLDSDPIYGCTDEPPTLVLGWTLSFTIVNHIYTCIYIRNQQKTLIQGHFKNIMKIFCIKRVKKKQDKMNIKKMNRMNTFSVHYGPLCIRYIMIGQI